MTTPDSLKLLLLAARQAKQVAFGWTPPLPNEMTLPATAEEESDGSNFLGMIRTLFLALRCPLRFTGMSPWQ